MKTKTTSYRALVESLPVGQLHQLLADASADGERGAAPVRFATLAPGELPARGGDDDLDQGAPDVFVLFSPPLEHRGCQVRSVYVSDGVLDIAETTSGEVTSLNLRGWPALRRRVISAVGA